MPLDDLSLSLTPARDEPPTVDLMVRVVRLPTASRRQALSIVKMQLDRLSPLPVADSVFDLAAVRQDGAETVYALGVIRRLALRDPVLSGQRTLTITRAVEGVDVRFRFRNPDAVDDREARLLRHAPVAAAIALGLAAIALAGNIRADKWRDTRLPEIAAARRAVAQQARLDREKTDARTLWVGLERTDAASRLLCVFSKISSATPGGISVVNVSADDKQVVFRLNASVAAPLSAAGATVDARAGANEPASATFGPDVCT